MIALMTGKVYIFPHFYRNATQMVLPYEASEIVTRAMWYV